MITLQSIYKSYSGIAALKSVDLEIQPQQTTVLIGPSGCGKSTCLRLMVGLAPPDSGTVMILGEEVNSQTIGSLRSKLGYMIQDGGLFPHLDAEHNITIMARYLDWNPERIQQRVGSLLELTQFPRGALHRYPIQLSGGQRQRVSLMRALMLDPEILLMDEPLGALDPLIRAELQSDMRNIFQELGKTVVMVTHDMGEAAFLGDQIVLMREGEIVQKGSLQALTRHPENEFVHQFINAQRSPWQHLEDSLS